jgi:hypothetical protein
MLLLNVEKFEKKITLHLVILVSAIILPDAIASQQGAGDPVQNSRRSYNESTELV